jgi:hypothetical protein
VTRVFRLNQIRRFGALLSVIAAWGMMGGHWVLPQAYAWGKMLVEYRRGTTIYKAAVDTFSGRRPCKMCRQIQTKQSERATSPVTLELLRAETAILPIASRSVARVAELVVTVPAVVPNLLFESFRAAPPTPPPRLS